jgi:predicted GH43/DUF377 family glycosyl hydrolase
VEPGTKVGTYRTYWSLLDAEDPSKVLRTDHAVLLGPEAGLTEHIAHQMYLEDVVFTTGIVEAEDHYIVASGESDVACRITHIPKARFA